MSRNNEYNTVNLHGYIEPDVGETVMIYEDVDKTIRNVCDRLRADLYAEVERVKNNLPEEYTEFKFIPGETEVASISFNYVAKRPETEKETDARLKKEHIASVKKEVALKRARAKDLATMKTLAEKYNIPLPVEVHG